jgi:hypothetical protein
MNGAPGLATNVCPQCGAGFRCGMEGGDAQCWCVTLPAFMPLPAKSASDSPDARCLCPECLKARLQQAGRN